MIFWFVSVLMFVAAADLRREGDELGAVGILRGAWLAMIISIALSLVSVAIGMVTL